MKTIKRFLPGYFKIQWLPLLFLPVVLSIGCNQAENEQLKQQNAMLEDQLRQKDSTLNMVMETFNEVDANLALIRQKEGLIEVDAEMNVDKKNKIVNEIQMINTLMEENRKKIASLQEELKKSGKSAKQFEKKLNLLQTQLDEKAKDIEKLKESLTNKDFEIAGLNTKLDTLNIQLASHMTVIQKQDTFIDMLDKELNTSYVAEGTYKELKEMGVIDNNGWTPWTGKKVALNENLSKAKFMEIDKRETTSIALNTKKAILVSDHPEGSYEFQKTDEGLIASLEIKDPFEFWSISKYLVVEVK